MWGSLRWTLGHQCEDLVFIWDRDWLYTKKNVFIGVYNDIWNQHRRYMWMYDSVLGSDLCSGS